MTPYDQYDSEKDLESRLRIWVAKKGGITLKLEGPGDRGKPDRLVLMPNALADFIELKSTGKKPSKLQLWWHKRLRNLGFRVYWFDNMIDLQNYLDTL